MNKTMAVLTASNEFLLKHLEEVKAENLRLKELVNKLKGKLVEERRSKLELGGAISPTSTIGDDLEKFLIRKL